MTRDEILVLPSMPHFNAPVADFPVRKVIGGRHFVADLTLPYGRVVTIPSLTTDIER